MKIHAALILQAVFYFNGERSINGIIHLLKGKRSTQTIQDGYLFNALQLFGLLSKSLPNDLLHLSKGLEELGLIYPVKENHYQITNAGKEQLDKFISQYSYLKNINGYLYKDTSKVFWLRFLLTVQTLSFTVKENHQFIPITQDKLTLFWVRSHFPKSLNERKQWATMLYREMDGFLGKMSELEATVFVYKLSGLKTLGLTNEQIGEKVDISKWEVDFILTSVVHKCLTEIKENPSQFPMLAFFAKDLFDETNITDSAKKTLKLFNEGYTLSEISNIRRLKEGTIEDHIIEMIIENPNLSIVRFVSNELEQDIVGLAAEIGSARLRPIKDKLGDKASYFQIRLVLTKLGGLNHGST